MVIGAAGELPKPPSTPTVFVEGALSSIYTLNCLSQYNTYFMIDLYETELAQAVSLFRIRIHIIYEAQKRR